MAEDNKIPIVIRTQVYLNDPDYFCNKSWTMSYNMNTKSWISFHSYLPNFYIGENNFFYSGLNGCCDTDAVGGFKAVAGRLDRTMPTTTSTTTFYPAPTTTSTTTVLDCTLIGVAYITSCELQGNAIITVPPTTTTTICQRPSNLLTRFNFIQGYTLGTDPEVIFTASMEDACNATAAIEYVFSLENTDDSVVNEFNGYATTTTDVLEIGSIVYYGDSLDCTFVPDGWYFAFSPLVLQFVYQISGGVVVYAGTCECELTTTTSTTMPILSECCGVILSSNDTLNYLNKTTNIISQLNVPDYTASYGIAMTSDYLWSVTTEFTQWDIATSRFSATYNRVIAFPVGFTTSSGMCALNSTTLVVIDDSSSPQVVREMNITDDVAIGTYVFDLQADRVAYGNPLYIQTGEIIIINKDVISSDYYISQYNYSTGALEIDINIGSVEATAIFECNCNIYVTTASGYLYEIIKIAPYVLFYVGYSLNLSSIGSATQVATCVVSSITDNSNITTTTTTTTP